MTILSKQQVAILVAIVEHKLHNDGNSPTLDDLVPIIGLGKTTIRYHIKRLVEQGWIVTSTYHSGYNVGGFWSPPGWYEEMKDA